jgi:circadian clock protein KaiC
VEELCSLGVTSICTAEASEIIGPTITAPLGGLSDVTDNHILVRFVEAGARLYRILSILKVRDSAFDSNLREFSITNTGIEIAADSGSAELIFSSLYRARPSELTVSENK